MQVLSAIDLRIQVCMLLLGVCVCAQDALGNPRQHGTEKPHVLWQNAAQIGEVDRNLDGLLGATFFLQADDVFPQASAIKIAVLAELYHHGQQSTYNKRNKAKPTDPYAVQSFDLLPDSAITSGLSSGVENVDAEGLATTRAAMQ
jgi:beta-lactamase class A